jgi:hypothetical protein
MKEWCFSMLHPDFLVASQWAEHCLEILYGAQGLAEEGKAEEAKNCLASIANVSSWHSEKGDNIFDAVRAMRDDLAGVAKRPIKLGRHSSPSAHEAVVFLADAVWLLLSYPEFVPSAGLCDRLGVGDISALTAYLRQERGRVLRGNAVPPEPQTAEPEKPPPRLTVDLKRQTLTLDAEVHEVPSLNALRWVMVLADRPGEWISKAQLKVYDAELDGVRPDKLKRYLPPKVLSLIDSETGKGSRIRL